MVKLNFFLIRKAHEYFTVIVQGEKEECQTALMPYFDEVRFKEARPLDDSSASKFKGNRPIGNNIIRGCYFTRDLRTLGEHDEPCTLEIDPRMEINNGVENVWVSCV